MFGMCSLMHAIPVHFQHNAPIPAQHDVTHLLDYTLISMRSCPSIQNQTIVDLKVLKLSKVNPSSLKSLLLK